MGESELADENKAKPPLQVCKIELERTQRQSARLDEAACAWKIQITAVATRLRLQMGGGRNNRERFHTYNKVYINFIVV